MPEGAAATWQSAESFLAFYAAHVGRVYTDSLMPWLRDSLLLRNGQYPPLGGLGLLEGKALPVTISGGHRDS